MSLPGPSSLARVAACLTSEALPHARSSSAASERGDKVHAFLAKCATIGPEDALEVVTDLDERAALCDIPLDRLPPLDPKHSAPEVSFGLTVATGECRELGRNLERDLVRALAKDGEMVGTADLVGLTADSAVIYDWKTGRGRIDRAEVNWQVKTYALMAARCYGRGNARASIVRVLDDGSVWYDTVEMDGLDLDAHEAELRALMLMRQEVLVGPAEKRPPLHEGQHCRYCPALPFCPAKVQLLQAAFTEAPLEQAAVELTTERAARAWRKLELAAKLVERLQAIVKDYARQHPVDLGDGYVLEELDVAKETIVPTRAKGALEVHFGEQLGSVVYAESVERSETLTKSALNAALRKHVLPVMPKEKAKITVVERELHATLRLKGAISVASYKQVKEHRAKRDAPKELPAKADEPPPGKEWDALTPEGRIEYGRTGSMEASQAHDLKRREERNARIQACEEAPEGHQWGRMGRCLKCDVRQPQAAGQGAP